MDISIINQLQFIGRTTCGESKDKMEIKIEVQKVGEAVCDCECLIIPLTEDKQGLQYYALSVEATGLIKKTTDSEFRGKLNETFLITSASSTGPERILLVGLGRREEITIEKLRQAGGKSAVCLRDLGKKNIAVSARFLASLSLSSSYFIEGALLGLYSFKSYSSEKNINQIKKITVLSDEPGELHEKLSITKTVASSVAFARDLVNTPSNDMTPSQLARTALSLKRKKLAVNVLDRKNAEKLGMGAYLAVARGSDEPPKFIVLNYQGAKGAPFVLIGKSITFDSGGISLKPAEGMEKMKYDMAGGAAVLGIMKAVSELKMPVNVIGILPATENLPGASATKPGDVVKSINGKYVEIINTDAEGRLIIADAIGYARRFKPRAIIDIATLTGACSIALGSEAAAMMGNNKELLDKLRKSADNTYERVWEMPLFEEYKEYLKSDIADIKNSSGRNGSLVTSAYFLYEFAGDTPWVHLDIAGTAWVEKDKPYIPKGASGIGVRLILDFLRS